MQLNTELLIRYIESGSDDSFTALIQKMYDYLPQRTHDAFRDDYPYWIWHKKKLQWVYRKLSESFPGDSRLSSDADSFLKGLFIMLGNTFTKDMRKLKKPNEILLGDNIDHQSDSSADEDYEDITDEDSSFTSDPFENLPCNEYAKLKLDDSVRSFILLRLRQLPMKFRIAILLVHLFPEIGWELNDEETEFLEALSGKTAFEIQKELEELRIEKHKPGIEHRYEIPVADIALLLGVTVDSLSQWLSRGRSSLKRIMSLDEA